MGIKTEDQALKVELMRIKRTLDEIEMGHCLWFYKAPESAAISATANWGGFTTLNALSRAFDWDGDLIMAASNECNSRDEVAVVTEVTPLLLLVPKTKAARGPQRLVEDLFAAAEEVGIKKLHLTHFGFLQTKVSVIEVKKVLLTLLTLNTKVDTVYLDIDSRVFNEIKAYCDALPIDLA